MSTSTEIDRVIKGFYCTNWLWLLAKCMEHVIYFVYPLGLPQKWLVKSHNWCNIAWSVIKETVEYLRIMFPGLRSIVVKNKTDAVSDHHIYCLHHSRPRWRRWSDQFHNASIAVTKQSHDMLESTVNRREATGDQYKWMNNFMPILPTTKISSGVTYMRKKSGSLLRWGSSAYGTVLISWNYQIQSF